GQASFSTSTLSVGSHTVTATYTPDDPWGSSSGETVQTVNSVGPACAAGDPFVVVTPPANLSEDQTASTTCGFVLTEQVGVTLTQPLGLDQSPIAGLTTLPPNSVVTSRLLHRDI